MGIANYASVHLENFRTVVILYYRTFPTPDASPAAQADQTREVHSVKAPSEALSHFLRLIFPNRRYMRRRNRSSVPPTTLFISNMSKGEQHILVHKSKEFPKKFNIVFREIPNRPSEISRAMRDRQGVLSRPDYSGVGSNAWIPGSGPRLFQRMASDRGTPWQRTRSQLDARVWGIHLVSIRTRWGGGGLSLFGCVGYVWY